jgi:hypothetical protein
MAHALAHLALTCAALGIAPSAFGAPQMKVLNHERIEIDAGLSPPAAPSEPRHLSFDAYGRRFDLTLKRNTRIFAAVPSGRTDVEPLEGTIDGQPSSWARLTQTRAGWRGVISDGHELYAIEPAADVAQFAVQPLTGTSPNTPIMYRLADAQMPQGLGFCATAEPSATSQKVTAQKAYDSLSGELTTLTDTGSNSTLLTQNTQPAAGSSPGQPARQLVVGVVADRAFVSAYSSDPEGAIVARMDIVDGIFSAQVGIKIVLGPVSLFHTVDEPFSSTTVPTDLLAEVRQFRADTPAQFAAGVTHLMTGRDLDGDIVGIAYLGSVCSGTAASLSQATISTLMSALITAHELGHNFNAPHDGVPGACPTTPQTFLMAPKINFSQQFSDCSLQQIEASAAGARCLTSTALSVNTTSGSSATGGNDNGGSGGGSGSGGSSTGNTPVSSGGGGRLDFALLTLLFACIAARIATNPPDPHRL